MILTDKGEFFEINRLEIEKFYKNKSTENKFIIDHPDQISEFYFCDKVGKLKYVIGNIYFKLYNSKTNELTYETKMSVIIDMSTIEKNDDGIFAKSFQILNRYSIENTDFSWVINNFEVDEEIMLNLNYKYNKLMQNKFSYVR